MADSTPVTLRMERIAKRFPGVVANDDVSLEVRAGEIHALLGENGAGKSTLMKILYGLHRPDHGRIVIDGRAVTIDSPRAAVRLKIGMVHQHFMLVPGLTGVENVVLGARLRRPPFLDLSSARDRLRRLAAEYRLDIDPDVPVWQLPVGAKQRLEILKALFRGARILILDEPTGVLTPPEVEQLFRIMRLLASQGCALIFISHKLDEVQAISDRVTVLRAGRDVGTVSIAEATPARLSQLMLGRELPVHTRSTSRRRGEPLLVMTDTSCLDDRGNLALRNLSLVVHGGEIVGVAGVDGNGQRELAECAAGLRRLTSGRITVAGGAHDAAAGRNRAVGFIPEDRQRTGLVPAFSIAENLVLNDFNQPPFTRWGMLRWSAIADHARAMMERFEIRAPGPETDVRNLSGGSQQRMVVARETHGERPILIAAHATRGLDIGAVANLHDLIRARCDRGAGVLYISSELSDLLAISDRLVVMYRGEIMGDVSRGSATVDEIGEMMMGRRAAAVSPGNGAGNAQ